MEDVETREEEAETPPEAMSESDLCSVVGHEVTAAIGYWSDQVAARHEESLREYMGDGYGDEREGYSQVVSRDIFETVQWILPDLLETFVGGDEVVRAEPTDEDDERMAELATARLNRCFLRENPGYLIAQTWMTDALIEQNGIVKFWVEAYAEVREERYPGLDEISLGTLMEDQTKRLVAHEQTEEGLHSVTVEIRTEKKRIVIENIPPEEFGINREARSLADARCVFHLTRTTEGALREMGYDEEKIRLCPGPAEENTSSQVQARRLNEGGGTDVFDTALRGGSERACEVLEAYVFVDFDGDGKSELRRIIGGGRDCSVLFANDKVSFVPFADLCAIPIPHRFYGMSVADALSDLQRIRTTIFRQYLDALYGLTRPRSIVTGTQEEGPLCDVDQLQDLRPMGFVTEYQAGAIRPFPIDPTVPEMAIQGLEFLKSAREERMGVSRVSTGSIGMMGDATSAIHGTARGIEKLQQSASKRVAMIARIFAETGWKALFRGLSNLMRELDDTSDFQHRGKWVSVPAQVFDQTRDITLSVGLGYGDRDQRFQGLMTIAGLQERIAAAGMAGTIVRPEHAYHLADELCDVLGYRNANRFFGDPASAPPAQPVPPEAWMVEVASKERIETEKLRLEELKIRLDFEVQLRKLGMEEARVDQEAAETVLPLMGGLVPGAQSQMAAEPRANGGAPAAPGGGPDPGGMPPPGL
jgi:hypothetical protein